VWEVVVPGRSAELKGERRKPGGTGGEASSGTDPMNWFGVTGPVKEKIGPKSRKMPLPDASEQDAKKEK